MRIISGIAKGKSLSAPRGKGIRPTSDKVKEALFDILRERVEGAIFLDLFAGTGGIGIESLSRGAEMAVFVEKNRAFLKILKGNLLSSSLISQADVYLTDAVEFIKKMNTLKRRFDLIFVDPPYHTGDVKRIFLCLSSLDIINENGLIIFEHFHKVKLDKSIGNLILYREYIYGDSVLTIYRKE